MYRSLYIELDIDKNIIILHEFSNKLPLKIDLMIY